MKPRDILMWRDDMYGHHRLWEVTGVFLGADGQESLIQIQSLTEMPGVAYGNPMPVLYVPEPLVRGLTLYTKQDAEIDVLGPRTVDA
jgi:hypothetical protein